MKKSIIFSLFFTFCYLLIAQRLEPDSISVIEIDHSNEILIIGEAIQDDDEETFRFSEEKTKTRLFTRKDLFIRYENTLSWTSIGHRGKNVQNLLANHPEALKEFKKYKRKLMWGTTSIFIGAGVGIGLSILTQNFIPVIVLVGGSGTGGVLMETTAEEHLYKAIEIYNASVIAQKTLK